MGQYCSIEKDYIFCWMTEAMSDAALSEMCSEVIAAVKASPAPALILCDASRVDGLMTREQRSILSGVMAEIKPRIKRLAIYGDKNVYEHAIVQVTISISGLNSIADSFYTREEAEKWLLGR